MNDDPRPFLSILGWPPDETRVSLAELLAAATGLDEASLRLRLGAPPPMIIGQVEPAIATLACEALAERGGDAFAPTFADLAALGPTLKMRDLAVGPAGLTITLWQGLTTTLRRDQVQILVRAQIRSETVVPEVARVSSPAAARLARQTLRVSLDRSAMGLARTWAGADLTGFDPSPPARRTETSDKLDVHTTDGSVYQIDGDKFAYHALGELRGYSDKANMDAMCDLLAHLAPDEIVDPYFTLWRPPARYQRLRIPGVRGQEDPAFRFYSRWAALMYRHLLGGSGR
ncbi:MAG: hypothetical protein HKO59_16360 [Phycisphaerales bacterium]|nr:hypothetical protein [Phycisphaerae bacterium]NNF42689.1 hypothetical protein [Phycisphaerales bacterium]NNM27525.1 hypothetical protein [Phycisphaerales bacterium]